MLKVSEDYEDSDDYNIDAVYGYPTDEIRRYHPTIHSLKPCGRVKESGKIAKQGESRVSLPGLTVQLWKTFGSTE